MAHRSQVTTFTQTSSHHTHTTTTPHSHHNRTTPTPQPFKVSVVWLWCGCGASNTTPTPQPHHTYNGVGVVRATPHQHHEPHHTNTTTAPQLHHTNFKRLWCWCGVGVVTIACEAVPAKPSVPQCWWAVAFGKFDKSVDLQTGVDNLNYLSVRQRYHPTTTVTVCVSVTGEVDQ